MSFRLTLGILTILLVLSCNPKEEAASFALYGEAQGTTYTIKYWGDSLRNYQTGIDSLLKELDSSLSTYLPESIISQVNIQQSTVIDNYLKTVFLNSFEIYEITDGAFDPSVMPLVRAWGFGPDDVPQIDTSLIDSLKSLVGLSQFSSYSVRRDNQEISSDTSYMIKTQRNLQLDFNGIAQGYSVDILAAYMEERGSRNFLIELGGEIKAKGKNSEGERWKIGIDKPEEHAKSRPLQATLALKDKAIATSGSYRKFYELDGVKYSHTIDPSTGYPVKHTLLSVTVMTGECMHADGYATAFMVMGFEKSKLFLEQNKDLGLEAYFIYSDENGDRLTYATKGLEIILNEDL
ncbi:MAG: FAD:protein FMN transferase [Flavobacteriales bacterium]|nr:FAD:protein FMN transferase [Flavobacteriales bacterium]